jgi:hypothetical protein
VLAVFPKGDPRAACQTLPARHAFYLPDPDFTGRDHVVVAFKDGESTFSDGIDIVVRRAEHPHLTAPKARCWNARAGSAAASWA